MATPMSPWKRRSSVALRCWAISVRLIAGFIPHDESPDYTSVQCLQDVLCSWDVLGVSKMKRDQDQEKRELSTLRLRTLNNEAEPLIGLGSSAPQPYPCLDARGRYRSSGSRRSSPCERQGLLDCSPRRRVLEIVERLLACRRCREVEAPHALHTSLRVVCRAGRAVGIESAIGCRSG
jgi:hypothetical protein